MIYKANELPINELEKIVIAIVDTVEHERGWKPEEYQVNFHVVDTDEKYGRFGVIRKDDYEEIKKWPPGRFGFHPNEFTVIVNMETWKGYIYDHKNPKPWLNEPHEQPARE